MPDTFDSRTVRVEWATLTATRPRQAGCNARRGIHGKEFGLPLARVTTADGAVGFGWSRVDADSARALVGRPVAEACSLESGVAEGCRAIEYPLWDLMGQVTLKPVYALVGGPEAAQGQFSAPCYDTSLYIDDLDAPDDRAGAALIAAEAREGYERGHRAFKIKIGRGAVHMPLEEGTRRDIAVIRAVREAVGPQPPILLDANNGYNLNLTKRVLAETADAGIVWMEEPFHEDPLLYGLLKEWLEQEGSEVLVADGEGDASTHLLDWARGGLIDVVQYDIHGFGFSRWLELGRRLDHWDVKSAPHHYGGLYGNYAACHLAAAIEGFVMAEWDEAQAPGLDASGYRVAEGRVQVPATPGFGLRLDDAVFAQAVRENGFSVS